MKGAKTEADFSGGSQIALQEQSVSSVDLASVLQLSDSEVAKLARSAVLVRERDSYDSRAYVYPLLENTKRYILHLRGKKETAGLLWLQEKSRTQRVMRQMQIARGKLVDPEKLYQELAPRMIKMRNAFEEALAAGVPTSIDGILAIFTEATEGIDEDGPEPRASRNGDTV